MRMKYERKFSFFYYVLPINDYGLPINAIND